MHAISTEFWGSIALFSVQISFVTSMLVSTYMMFEISTAKVSWSQSRICKASLLYKKYIPSKLDGFILKNLMQLER